LKFSITVSLKRDVLDPQGKIVKQTVQGMGFNTVSNIRQGKYFEIDLDENDNDIAKKKIDEMCKKLLVNLVIEDYKINKI
jgi:phosphoribosylformylglycinamidine synthase PurS subunit|tara:strand:- start:221 stop:460 length:240 start_codon:yes stop_codon:yes gene_type:complete